MGQLIFFFIKTGRFDWFVLLDVGLILGLGVIAIISKNEMFFKVKPAIIEGATIILFIVFYFMPDGFLLDYFGRMLPVDKSLNPAIIAPMKMMLLGMCAYVLLHIGAVLYTAYFCSRRTWAFVSGPGFFLVFIPIMAFILVKKARNRHLKR